MRPRGLGISRDIPWNDVVGVLGPSRADTIARMRALAQLLDSAVRVPGTNRTVGVDAMLGLVPGVGDAISAALSSYIIFEARRLGLPKHKLARMVANLALDTAIGAVPLVGDLFDMAFKANRRNLNIVMEHFGHEFHGPAGRARFREVRR